MNYLNTFFSNLALPYRKSSSLNHALIHLIECQKKKKSKVPDSKTHDQLTAKMNAR